MISNNVYYLSNGSIYKFYGLEKLRAEATAECDVRGGKRISEVVANNSSESLAANVGH